MSDNVTITFTAKEDVVSALRKMSDEAKKAATSLDKMGKEGAEAGKDIEKGTKGADAALRTFERNSLAAGAALGTLAMYTVRVSAAYQDQQRQLDAIGRLYGENAQRAIEYAEAIQDTTRFSNDAARDSLVLLNTLSQNYGMQQSQIEALLSRSTDLAQVHGRSLTEITQMISNALRGEGEYIEQIGVSMNQMFVAAEAAARGMDDFIYGMTAAEQAAFRYTLLMEQTATATGAAFAAMEGSRGVTAVMINGMQDFGQSVGGALGPVRNLAAEFNNYALWLPLIGSQVARMGALFINMGKSGSIAANSMSALRFATNPVTLGIAALTAVLGVVGAKYLENKVKADQLKATNEQLAQSYQSLNEAISNAYLSGDKSAADFVRSQSTWLDTWVADWNGAVEATAKNMQSEDNFDWMPDFVENLSRGLVIAGEEIGALFGADTPMADAMAKGTQEAFVEAFKIPETEITAINNEMQRVLQLAMTPGVDQAKFETDWNDFLIGLYGDLATGDIMPEQISEEMAKWRASYAEEMAATIDQIETSKADLERAFEMDELRLDGWSDAQVGILEQFDASITAIDDYKRAWIEASSQIGIVAGAPLFQDSDISHLKMTQEETELTALSFQRLREVMLSGDWNNAAIADQIEWINGLFQSGQIDAATYTTMIMNLATGGYQELGTAADQAAAKLGNLDHIIRDQVTNIGDLSDAMLEGAGAAMEYAAAQASAQEKFAASSREATRQRIQDMRDLQAAQKEFLTDYMASAGFDTPLAQVNLTSLRSDASGLAGDFAMATAQLENMFRAIVGNTDAIKSQADAVLTWATELINVRGELGIIDDLLSKELIDADQYNAAQDAYDGIAASTLQITDNLNAVQAIQAPIIAQSMEWQAQLTADLLQQDAATQRVTLGWMDATSAAQAFQLVQQLTLMQSGELGAVSEQTMSTIVQGAVMANPLLFDMLTSMGVISGTPLNFKINTDALEGAQSELEALTSSITDLVTTLREMYNLEPILIPITVEPVMDQEGIGWNENWLNGGQPVEQEVIPVWQGGGAGGDGTGGAAWPGDPMKVPVVPDFTANAAWDETSSSAWGATPMQVPAELDIQEPAAMEEPMNYPVTPVVTGEIEVPEPPPLEVMITADSSQVSAAVQVWAGSQISGPMFLFQQDSSQVSAASQVWMGSVFSGPTFNFVPNYDAVNLSASITANASYDGPTFNFVANTSAVYAAANGIAGSVLGTAYINVQTRMVGGANVNNRMHGGKIDSFSTGGQVIYHAAEGNNPELAREPNGSSYMLHREGLYAGPRGTIISPSNAHRGKSTGLRDVVLNVYGNIYGDDDLVDRVSDRVVPVLIEVVEDTRDAQPRIR